MLTFLSYVQLKINDFQSELPIEYYKNPILKGRYLECCKVLLDSENDNPFEIFGFGDALKVQISKQRKKLPEKAAFAFKRNYLLFFLNSYLSKRPLI